MQPRQKVIQTPRLTLRPFAESDRENVLSVLNNDEVGKTYMIPDFASINEADALFHRLMELSCAESRFVYAVTLNGVLIGWVNDCGIEGTSIELGYVIHPDHKNKGYMTEALTACIAELFRRGYEKINCGYFEENAASHRVMLKAGMRDTEQTDTVDYRGASYLCRYCVITQ